MTDTWQKLLEFETRDLVERYVKTKYDRGTSKKQIIEITSNFIQAREYFKNAKQNALRVRPLLQHYGVASLTRGLILVTNPHLNESSLKGAHGLETNDWRGTLVDKRFEELTVTIKNGTFYELLSLTANKSYYRHNSSGVGWSMNHDIPELGTKIKLKDLLRTITDLSEEYRSWTDEKITFANLKKVQSNGSDYHYHIEKGVGFKSTDDVSLIFPKSQYEKVEYRGLLVVASNETMPQLSQRFFDSFNTGIGEIVITKPIAKNIHLNTLSQFYILSYYMGMLARYFPSIWMSLGRSEKGDAIYPLFIKAMSHINSFFPSVVLDFLSGPYDFEQGQEEN